MMIDAEHCDLGNMGLVSVSPATGTVTVMCCRNQMTREEALVHAAWLVALAEEEKGQFQTILDRVWGI